MRAPLAADRETVSQTNHDTMSREESEGPVRDLLMEVLFASLGVKESWRGEGKTAAFNITGQSLSAVFRAEQSIEYALPQGGSLSHKTDILVTVNGAATGKTGARYICIEVKHRSAVTDTFKCRAYDMFHLKQTHGTALLGLLVYIRANTGISFQQAQRICYSYDRFFGIDFFKIEEPGVLADIVRAVANELT